MVKPKMRKPTLPMIGAGRPPEAPKAATGRPIEDDEAEGEPDSTALFIAQMTTELGQLAQSAGFALLTYLLDVARLEAELHCLRQDGSELPSGGMKLPG